MNDLDGALRAWRDNPHPRIAESITQLSKVYAKRRPSIHSAGGKKKGWWARSRARDPRDVDLLLDMALDSYLGDASDRIRELASWPLDPRIRDALVKFVDASSHERRLRNSDAQLAGVEALFRYAHLPDVSSELDSWMPKGRRVSWLGTRPTPLLRHRPRVALAVVRPPDEGWLASLSGPAVSSVRDVSSLWKDVWKNPTDVNPLRVLSDALSEEEDPRGEFIALQLSNTGKRRQRELLGSWESTWLGHLDEDLARTGRVWRGGLLREARVAAWDLRVHPMLSAMERLSFNLDGRLGTLDLESVMPNLTHLTRCDVHPIQHTRVHTLGLGSTPDSRNPVISGVLDRFPSLRNLRVNLPLPCADYAELAMHPRFEQLESIQVAHYFYDAGDCTERLRCALEHLGRVPHLVLAQSGRGWELHLRPGAVPVLMLRSTAELYAPAHSARRIVSLLQSSGLTPVIVRTLRRSKLDPIRFSQNVDATWEEVSRFE